MMKYIERVDVTTSSLVGKLLRWYNVIVSIYIVR